jgi:acyl-CoA thioester hydrolase
VVAQLTIQFVAEAFFPAPIDAGIGVIRIGNSSYVLGCGLFQEGRCVAVQDATLVYRAAQGALSLPAEVRARMERYRL